MSEELSQNAKDLITQMLIGVAANTLADVASVRSVATAAGEQNINPVLAKKLIEEFKVLHGLKTPVEYTGNRHKTPGPYFDSTKGKTGRIAGPTGDVALKAIKDRDHARMLTLDAPEVALHELGHAKRFSDRAWSSRWYSSGLLSQVGSMILMGTGFPGTAAVVAAVGSIPTLYEERKASELAMEFLRAKLPKDEADKAARVLDRCFRTYLNQTIAAVGAPVAYGFIRGMQNAQSRK